MKFSIADCQFAIGRRLGETNRKSQIANRKSSKARGMTLIELMMAFAILLTGLTVIFALMLAGANSHRRAIKETDASLCAASTLADMRAEFAHGAMPHTETVSFFEPSKDFPGCAYNRSVIPLEPPRKGMSKGVAGHEYFVRVKVRWSEKGDNQSIEVNTIMYLNEDFKR